MSVFKYVRFTDAGFVIWPEKVGLTHSVVAEKFENDQPFSAGFCYLNSDNQWVCHGKSVSLKLSSHETDSARLTDQYGY